MTPAPVVIISPHTPLLEGFALSVLWGAAEASKTFPHPLIVGDPGDRLPSVVDEPVVFLGWRGDLEESRRFGEETLAKLARPPAGPRRVVAFEVTVREAWGGTDEARGEERRNSPSTATTLALPERFVVDNNPGVDPTGLLELARARQWGAQMFSGRMARDPQPSEERHAETPSSRGPPAPFRGAPDGEPSEE